MSDFRSSLLPLVANKVVNRKDSGDRELVAGWLDAPKSWATVLNFPHGVDYGHLQDPLDIHRPWPIHWCHNEAVYHRARDIKAAVLGPHPFEIALQNRRRDSGAIGPCRSRSGRLVVAPTSTHENFRSLKDLLLRNNIVGGSILYKVRDKKSMEAVREAEQTYGSSWQFITLGARSSDHYTPLASLLSTVEQVICPYNSSVMIFAAAAGCKIEILKGYKYFDNHLDSRCKVSGCYVAESGHPAGVDKDFVMAVLSGQEVEQKAHDILGGHLLYDAYAVRDAIAGELVRLGLPDVLALISEGLRVPKRGFTSHLRSSPIRRFMRPRVVHLLDGFPYGDLSSPRDDSAISGL